MAFDKKLLELGDRAYVEGILPEPVYQRTTQPIPQVVLDAWSSDDPSAFTRYVEEDGTFGGHFWALHSLPEIGLLGVIDDAGRPIREGRALPSLHPRFEVREVKCPYRDSRFEHENPMNVSALKEMSRDWTAMITFVDMVRERHLRELGVEEVTESHLFHVASFFDRLPWYVLRQRHRPLQNGELPALVAGTFKLFIGGQAVIQPLSIDALLQRITGAERDEALTGELLHRLANVDRGDGDVPETVLIGPVHVCSGTIPQIIESMDVLIRPWDKRPPPGDPVYARIAAAVPELDQAFVYLHAQTNIRASGLHRALGDRLVLEDLVREVPEDPELWAQLEPHLAPMPEDLRAEALRDTSFEERVTLYAWFEELLIPPVGPWADDKTVAWCDEMGDAWTRPRDRAAGDLARLLEAAGARGEPAALRALADKVLVTLEIQRLRGEAVLDADALLHRAAGDLEHEREPNNERVLREGGGDDFVRMLEDAFGLTRETRGARTTLRAGDHELVFDGPLYDR